MLENLAPSIEVMTLLGVDCKRKVVVNLGRTFNGAKEANTINSIFTQKNFYAVDSLSIFKFIW